MAMGAASAKGAVAANINVTPMIDVMLVLLIIFMIVTPAITAGFQATIPRAKNPDAKEEGEGEIRLGIDNLGKFYLDMKPIAKEQLETQLQAIYSARTKDKILYFKADVNVKYGKIQEAVEIARRTGVRVLAAVTENKSPQGLFTQPQEP